MRALAGCLAGFRAGAVGALTAALLAVAVVVFPATGLAQEEVTFVDPNLEAAIREVLRKPTGPVTDADLAGLTWLWVADAGIADLVGLEYCVNLYSAALEDNQISDLSPLSGLTNLYQLDLDNNQVSDLSGLSGLTSLERLSLDNNQVSDLSGLGGATVLRELHLNKNQVTDLTPLSGLTSLESLYLDNNQVSDLTPLGGLISLWYLDLSGNPLNQEAYETHIPALEARGVDVLFDPPTAVAEEQEGSAVPSAYALYPNAPNPFNPLTSIAYDLPEAAQVSLSVYNGLGQRIATLVSATQQPGRYTLRWDASGLASGMYFYRLEAGSFSKTRRMVLLR